MNRIEFHKQFKSPGPVVLPVVHVQDLEQTARNVRLAMDVGAPGVLLINNTVPLEILYHAAAEIRMQFPTLWLGVNFLAVTGRHAFGKLGDWQRDGIAVDGYWADDARIDEMLEVDDQIEAAAINDARRKSGWNGLYMGGTCFKKQRAVSPDYFEKSARIAKHWMDVVTTSGIATGFAPELSKIETFRRGVGDAPLALASGITPANAEVFAPIVDCFIVGTGINYDGDFYNFDPSKIARMMQLVRKLAL